MNLFDTTQIALERAIGGSAMRQTALADNVANANTPGYQPKDVDFKSALRGALDEGRSAVENVAPQTTNDSSALMRADGSGFDIDQQSAKLAQNGLEYEAMMSIAAGRNAIMRAAMGR